MSRGPIHELKDGLNPQTEWYTVEEAARYTGRHVMLIHRWIKQGRFSEDHIIRSDTWPYPYLLSPLVLGQIVTQPKRNRRASPGAYRPAGKMNESQ